MSDTALLKKLLEAENAGRELVGQAQQTADKRVHEVLASLQEDLRAAREEMIARIAAEEEAFTRELSDRQRQRLSEFEEDLRKRKIFSEDAERELKKILLS
jgi:thiamine pyrophosphate-dependent acetolactate synthase large subunit-like protein